MPGRHRGLVPAGVIVVVYVVFGVLWILGGDLVADSIAEVSSIPRAVLELSKGVVFVLLTALVLQVLMRRRADRLDRAAIGAREDGDRITASEDRNRLQAAALAGTANAVVITDRDGTIEWVNAAFETMSGYPSSLAVGSTPKLLRSGMQDDGFYEELWGTILAGEVWRGQLVNRRSDGELYTVSQTITPVVAQSGEIEKFVAIHEDVTERLLAAGELEVSRVRLQSLFDHAIDAIVLADDQGRYLEVNPAVCELTGYSREELLGIRAADLAASAEQAAEAAGRFEAFVILGAESGTFVLRHKDGHVVETEYRAVANIQPGVHLSVLRDMTAHNRMLRALTTAEAQFRELAENDADIVTTLRIDRDGRVEIDYVNPAVAAVLGYPRDHLYRHPGLLFELFRQRRGDLEDPLDLLPTPEEPTKLATVQVQRRDGRLVWLEIHSTLTDPSTSPGTVQLVACDVTARLEMTEALEEALQDQLLAAEQLRALDAMKGTFLQSVSHELRTPLTSILGFARLLTDPRHGLSPQDTRDFHGRILSSAQRLQRLLDDLLDVDRFARGQLEPRRRSTDLSDLVERTVDELDLADHPVELDLEPLVMELDAPWVERIVANLLRNVVGHTPPETRVWLRTRATTDGVELVVEDDGPGIPEADRQRVIEPFQQGPGAASSAQPGTGVGLSLVNTFAVLHGGGLTIGDSSTGGTRATVTLAHAGPDGSTAHRGGRGSDAMSLPIVLASDAAASEPGQDAAATTERTTNDALRELLQARTADQVRGIVLSLVHRLGGWTVPARLADATALPIDLSFGIDDPLLPAAEHDGAARSALERHLPRLVEDARRALENLARADKLAHDASVDPLTGLLNRRSYERVLPRLQPGDSVVLFDLDRFKALNDTRGHEAGDQVLRSFGLTLRSFTRATDHPCRIGGDEFALFLEGTSSADAGHLIGRFRSLWGQQRPWPVTFSVGIATVAADPAAAVAAADRAMYAAKRSAHRRRSDATAHREGAPS